MPIRLTEVKAGDDVALAQIFVLQTFAFRNTLGNQVVQNRAHAVDVSLGSRL